MPPVPPWPAAPPVPPLPPAATAPEPPVPSSSGSEPQAAPTSERRRPNATPPQMTVREHPFESAISSPRCGGRDHSIMAKVAEQEPARFPSGCSDVAGSLPFGGHRESDPPRPSRTAGLWDAARWRGGAAFAARYWVGPRVR
nr:MAG: hypothetical protein DIU72_06700 [Pseudomonadota bacterium]